MSTLQMKVPKPVRQKLPTSAESVRENRKKEFLEQFEALGRRIEKYQAEQGNPEPPSMEEIVAIVKEVRAERYAKQIKQ
ncbi:hypothetical protein FACS1894170_08560 [Planctomycetales bacterium]|nr:hypothetical protein FACS1894170_08560 [Planctomycetales bacterium]